MYYLRRDVTKFHYLLKRILQSNLHFELFRGVLESIRTIISYNIQLHILLIYT